MVRTALHVVVCVASAVMVSSIGVPDEYRPSDQFNKRSSGTTNCVEYRRDLGSLCAMANITDHPNSTTVPHEHVWMSILGCGGLADYVCTRLVNLSWLGIVVMGTFMWRPMRWTPPHVLILIATVTAAVASLFFAIAHIAALFVACVGLVMLVVNWHFGLRVCVAMSLAYWCSALWIGWTMSPLGGVALGVIAVTVRCSVVLFPFTVKMKDCERSESFEADEKESSKWHAQFVRLFRLPSSNLVIRNNHGTALGDHQPFINDVAYTIEVLQGKFMLILPPKPRVACFLVRVNTPLNQSCLAW